MPGENVRSILESAVYFSTHCQQIAIDQDDDFTGPSSSINTNTPIANQQHLTPTQPFANWSSTTNGDSECPDSVSLSIASDGSLNTSDEEDPGPTRLLF